MATKTRHLQQAIELPSGRWQVKCECGAVGAPRSTNYEAWQAPLNHRGPGR